MKGLRRWIGFCMGLAIALSAKGALTDSLAALQLLASCKEQSDANSCKRAIGLGLWAKRAAEAYTFWADNFPVQNVPTAEPENLLRKAIQLDRNNALATYLLATYLPRWNYRLLQEKKKLLERAAELRPDWDSPHAQLATLAAPCQYNVMIQEWSKALELAPDDPIYRKSLEDAKRNRESIDAKLHEMEEKAKTDPKTWASSAAQAATAVCDVPEAEKYATITGQFWPTSVPLLLERVYSACGQYEKARELNRKLIDSYEKRLDSGLKVSEIQVGDLIFLELPPEAFRVDLLEATLNERSGTWWRAQQWLEGAAQIAPSAEIYGRLATDTLKSAGAMNRSLIMEYVEKGLKLDPKLLEEFPDLKPYAPAEPKK